MAAHEEQVIHVGGPPLRPVPYVVRAAPAGAPAPREAAAPVAVAELAAKPGRRLTSGAPDADRGSVGAVGHNLDAGVAGQAPGDLGGKGSCPIHLGHALSPGQELGIDVDHDRCPVGIGIGCNPGRGKLHQCVGKAGVVGMKQPGCRIGGGLVDEAVEGCDDNRPIGCGEMSSKAQPLGLVPPPPEGSARPIGALLTASPAATGKGRKLGSRAALPAGPGLRRWRGWRTRSGQQPGRRTGAR